VDHCTQSWPRIRPCFFKSIVVTRNKKLLVYFSEKRIILKMKYLVPSLLDLTSSQPVRGNCVGGSGATVDGGGGNLSLCVTGNSPNSGGGGSNSCVGGTGNATVWFTYNCLTGSTVTTSGCGVGSDNSLAGDLDPCYSGTSG